MDTFVAFALASVISFGFGYYFRIYFETRDSQVLPEITGTILSVKGDVRSATREAVFLSEAGKKLLAVESFNDSAKGKRCIFSEPCIRDGRLVYTKVKYVD
jgi:hypothetical protein